MYCFKSFNPYSVGCRSGSKDQLLIVDRQGFQSLFCWMSFWKGTSYRGFATRAEVSILILLDVVLEASRFVPRGHNDVSFNPYSVGCRSGRVVKNESVVSDLGFNPYSVIFGQTDHPVPI